MIRKFIPFVGTATSGESGDSTPESQHASDGESQPESTADSSTAPTPAQSDQVPDGHHEATTNSAYTVEHDPSESTLQTPSDIHGSLVAPDALTEQPAHVDRGDAVTRTHWIGEFPDIPQDGLYQSLYAGAATSKTDIALHLEPRDTQDTLRTLESEIEELQADVNRLQEKQRASARGLQKDLEDHQDLYDALRNTPETAFDVSMYMATHTTTEDALESRANRVATASRKAPANLTPVVPRWAQLDATIAASPLATDRLATTLDTTTPMLAGALGPMFPFVAGAFAEQGIEYGSYAENDSPLILDRFARETGYSMMTIGRLGAGKSFATKLQLLRRKMYDPETRIVMIDPLRGFADIADALDAERITVGGTRGLNPLEIQAPTETVQARTGDIDPLAARQTQVMGFFETFFKEIATNPLGDRKQTLRRAVQEAYAQQGIETDPATHGNPSPTITDVLDCLEQLLEDPAAFGYTTDGEQERVQTQVESLLTDLRPSFRVGGELENLTRPTEFDIDAPVVYLDLHQQEGFRDGTETSLMLSVLFNQVVETAKATDRQMILSIDEAHYLMGETSSLEFLETSVRHSRHYDLSIQFITQTGKEFSLTPQARTIANLCSLTMLHTVDESEQNLMEWFDLTQEQAEWVKSAAAGKDATGYSEALLEIGESGWYPLRIRGSPAEESLIDTDDEQKRGEVP